MPRRQNPGPPVDPVAAMNAARRFIKIAKSQNITAAVGGGMAMMCYGLVRSTQDLDIIADGLPDIPESVDLGPLTFGGRAARTDGIVVDWIVRNDERAEVYAAALEDIRYRSPWKAGGRVPVISAEWLVIMKNLAGRPKDESDLLWLLSQPRLVNRKLIDKHIRQLLGKHAYAWLDNLQSYYLEADFLRSRQE